MDDDVKNLFQKFGQSTEAYREINRDADSEQAKLRWPLLRDVHLHAGPAPARADHRDEELPEPVRHNETPFRPAASKPVASRATAVKTVPLQAAAEVHVHGKPAAQLSLKQMLMQQAAVEEPEAEVEVVSPFLSRILPAAPRQNVASRKEAASSGLFFNRTQAEHEAEVPVPATPVSAVMASTRKPVSMAPAQTPATAATFIHNIPAAHVVPAKQVQSSVEEVVTQKVAGKSVAKDQPVSAVFGRLAGKQDEARPEETGSNSFFKKLFKP